MTALASNLLQEVEIFRDNARTTHQIVKLNLDGLTHEDSLISPEPGGNCLNWVLGHLVYVYDQFLPLLGQPPVFEPGALSRYARGTPPLRNRGEAVEFSRLINGWDQVAERVDAGLASLTEDQLNRPAPSSPRDNPNESVRSLLGVVSFHQAYHAGQTGLLRRIAGKNGAIA